MHLYIVKKEMLKIVFTFFSAIFIYVYDTIKLGKGTERMKKTPKKPADFFVFLAVMIAANIVAFPIYRLLEASSPYIVCIYILAVALVARWTDGYLYGVLASFLGVICVNFLFTYPYMAFNFTITGYPIAFVTMLTVSVVISALTTATKDREQIRIEAEKEKMRANLLRALSHDIRTPLTTIVSATNAMLTQDGIDESQRRELLEEVNEDAQELIKMVENILSITKMGQNAAITRTDELAEEIISSAVLKFRRKFSHINVVQKIPDDIVMLSCDPMLIEQVIFNLLENSAVHGKNTSFITIELTLWGKTAVFTISDDGGGIDPGAMDKLFDDYIDKAGSGTRSDQKNNMGIGLSLCRTIINAHGGEITAENTEQGALFRFTLPTGE